MRQRKAFWCEVHFRELLSPFRKWIKLHPARFGWDVSKVWAISIGAIVCFAACTSGALLSAIVLKVQDLNAEIALVLAAKHVFVSSAPPQIDEALTCIYIRKGRLCKPYRHGPPGFMRTKYPRTIYPGSHAGNDGRAWLSIPIVKVLRQSPELWSIGIDLRVNAERWGVPAIFDTHHKQIAWFPSSRIISRFESEWERWRITNIRSLRNDRAGSVDGIRLTKSLRLLLDFTQGIAHRFQLTGGYAGVMPCSPCGDGGSDEGKKGNQVKKVLLPVLLLAIGGGMTAVVFYSVEFRDPPWFPLLLGLAGAFGCLVNGAGLLLERFLNRTQLRLQQCHQGIQLATEHGLVSAFERRIMRTDETRIPRRTEGGGEFRAASAGCSSDFASRESEAASPQAYTRQKDRRRQGLERFLLPRPCLRRVAPCC